VDEFLLDLQATEGLTLRQLFNELDLNKDNTVGEKNATTIIITTTIRLEERQQCWPL